MMARSGGAVRFSCCEDAAMALFEHASPATRAKMLELLADAFVDAIAPQDLWRRMEPIIDSLSQRALFRLAELWDPPSVDDWFRAGLKSLVAHDGPGRYEAARIICRQHITDAVRGPSRGPVGDPALDIIQQITEPFDDQRAGRLIDQLSALYAADRVGSRN